MPGDRGHQREEEGEGQILEIDAAFGSQLFGTHVKRPRQTPCARGAPGAAELIKVVVEDPDLTLEITEDRSNLVVGRSDSHRQLRQREDGPFGEPRAD